MSQGDEASTKAPSCSTTAFAAARARLSRPASPPAADTASAVVVMSLAVLPVMAPLADKRDAAPEPLSSATLLASNAPPRAVSRDAVLPAMVNVAASSCEPVTERLLANAADCCRAENNSPPPACAA